MATLAPPPPTAPPGKRRPAARKRTLDAAWIRRLTRSGYFLGAVLFHLILILILATWVVFQAPPPPQEEFQKTYVPPAAPPPPPPPQPQQTMAVPAQALANPQPIIMAPTATAPPFTVPLPNLTTVSPLNQPAKPVPAMKSPNTLLQRLPAIRDMETNHWGRSPDNIRESNGDPHNVVATFPVFVASYQDGDWNCNLKVDKGQIVAGSIPDLVEKINEWSHGNLRGNVEPTPLAIGGPDLMAKMPPFIFFTGHKDFKLTEQEVSNLRDYLQNGGCIWGDNALPGAGSRFDIAFRREMKRVIPDIDKNFEALPVTSELFTQGWFPLDHVPPGMNYYAEPIEHIDIDGKLAILYTLNDYSDLYFMHILPGDTEVQMTNPVPGAPLFTNRFFVYNSKVFFRNFTLEGGLGAYRLGMNIMGHLLVRFDKELMSAP